MFNFEFVNCWLGEQMFDSILMRISNLYWLGYNTCNVENGSIENAYRRKTAWRHPISHNETRFFIKLVNPLQSSALFKRKAKHWAMEKFLNSSKWGTSTAPRFKKISFRRSFNSAPLENASGFTFNEFRKCNLGLLCEWLSKFEVRYLVISFYENAEMGLERK